MVNLKVFNDTVKKGGKLYPVFDIEIVHKVNFVIGLSGSGKSYFVKALSEATGTAFGFWHIKCDIPVVVISDSGLTEKSILNTISENENSLIVCDEAAVLFMRKKQLIGKLKKSKNYFLMCDRTSIVKEDLNVNSIFEFRYKNINGHKAFDTIKTFSMKKSKNTFDVDFAVTEDSESGLQFWTKTLSKLYIPKFKRHGNGEVFKQIKYINKTYDGNILVILDYDRGAIMMQKIINNKRIDKSRIYFMPLESFEEVICNSEFILDKFPNIRDFVINYENHLDYTNESTGKYFSTLLFNVVKVKSPLKKPGDKGYTKFYEKGMKNFKECFMNDCCAYNKDECKLYFDGDKKKAMLANKFEIYRKFV